MVQFLSIKFSDSFTITAFKKNDRIVVWRDTRENLIFLNNSVCIMPTPLKKKLTRFVYNKFTKDSIWKEIKANHYEILDGQRFWLISDMHFNHKNIISFCRHDCFKNVQQMNRRMIHNWNYRVGNFDKVLNIGDFGDARFIRQLNGSITIAKGNHDRKQWNRLYVLNYRNMKFLVTHNPNNATTWFDGDWIIHGHTHINTPFIDIFRKRVNVCVEMINYTPLNMEEIYNVIKESANYNDNRWFL
jgi:calcineurin-like phosphoesterase family protein